MQRIAIIGFGREGQALFKYLKKQKLGSEITILDRKSDNGYLKGLEQFDLIYRSPGVPYNLPQIQRAIKNGVRFSSATKLFFENAKGKIIGVTGTKGKGTTSTLIYKILKNAGRDAYLAGNIGKPAISILDHLNDDSITVLELSSFQLQDLDRSPDIAAVLGIFPDHMDAHKNFKEYFESKAQITKFQNTKDKVFYVAGNKYAKRIAEASRGRKIAVDTDSPIIDLNELKIRGRHNLINVSIATAIARELNVPERIISDTIKRYRGLPFRLQYVGKIKGMSIYNDSASTNPLTTVAAINAFDEKIILIMGGQDKNLDFRPVKKALKTSNNVKSVIIYGADRIKINNSIKGVVPIRIISGDLEKALRTALSESSDRNVIVFSPGATSFDMFKDYVQRGKFFDSIVNKLK